MRRARAVDVERGGCIGLFRVAQLETEGDRCRLVAAAEERRQAGDRVHPGAGLDSKRTCARRQVDGAGRLAPSQAPSGRLQVRFSVHGRGREQ